MTPAPSVIRQSTLARAVLALYLATLALLPWTWFPPFPWLQEHAQWADAVFAVTAVLWAVDKWKARRRVQFHMAHVAIALYFIAAAFSLLFASANKTTGAIKLLGIGELCLLAVITGDLACQPGAMRAIARVTVLNALATAAAAICGLILFYAGIITPLIGSYGDLAPSDLYARVQAGFYNPNLLVSYSIFAAAIVNHRDAKVPGALRRASLASLWLLALLTFSRGILGFVLAALLRGAHTRVRRILAISFAAVSLAGILLLSIYQLSLNPADPLSFRFDATVPASRYQTTSTALDTLIGSPLWGSGTGSHPGRYNGRPYDAHLTPLNIAATLGLPALAAFIWLLITLWRKRQRPTEMALWGGLAGMALDAMGQDVEDFRHLWVMMGIAIVSEKIAKEPETTSPRAL